ncbi:YbgA family protein [Alkalimarinus alittae]|uniref:DUF523 and DUF1722 domain-containing protein n=1 Tax=Alkalimarinus alittae TaxID=2961619 RepID=A0ABY6MYW7_9ALTE|nr:DUF523 and DUF1722 domain-containing protein [Alkalimarinus alittae]UZE95018.1 DUF523 and DUF1722 domain-containing protein [Alkalimarinus alittae]
MKIPIGISSCLLGEKVRYDGGHKNHSYISGTLSEYFEFKPFCPEMSIGMGVPRKPIRLVQVDQDIQCVGVTDDTINVTEQLTECADSQFDLQNALCGYIFKKDSPSCGMERVKVFTNGQPIRKGSGLFAKRTMENLPYLPIEEEGRLGDSRLRENFIQRVYVLHRWRQLLQDGLTLHKLIQFHSRHKLIIMSHHQQEYRDLGKLIATANKENLGQVADQYLLNLMTTLKTVATRKNHVNVLQHIQGYLKRTLDLDDKAELTEVIERYRLEELPLIVPITLLKHHFRKAPDEYINESYYMNPHPKELKLLNTL